MARRPSAAELERRAARARAREAYQRPIPEQNAVVNQRGAEEALFYRSLLRKTGPTVHVIYDCNVLEESLTAVGGAAAVGLLTVLADADDSAGSMRRKIQPSRIHWYKGVTSPRRQTTPWGSSWSRYYETGSHQSVPVSQAAGAFDAGDLRGVFTGLFGPAGTRRTLLGDRNGRCYLELEKETEKFSFES